MFEVETTVNDPILIGFRVINRINRTKPSSEEKWQKLIFEVAGLMDSAPVGQPVKKNGKAAQSASSNTVKTNNICNRMLEIERSLKWGFTKTIALWCIRSTEKMTMNT